MQTLLASPLLLSPASSSSPSPERRGPHSLVSCVHMLSAGVVTRKRLGAGSRSQMQVLTAVFASVLHKGDVLATVRPNVGHHFLNYKWLQKLYVLF